MSCLGYAVFFPRQKIRLVGVVLGIFFFFSSRRRHTISLCDWSSDVCSSDLHALDGMTGLHDALTAAVEQVDAIERVEARPEGARADRELAGGPAPANHSKRVLVARRAQVGARDRARAGRGGQGAGGGAVTVCRALPCRGRRA